MREADRRERGQNRRERGQREGGSETSRQDAFPQSEASRDLNAHFSFEHTVICSSLFEWLNTSMGCRGNVLCLSLSLLPSFSRSLADVENEGCGSVAVDMASAATTSTLVQPCSPTPTSTPVPSSSPTTARALRLQRRTRAREQMTGVASDTTQPTNEPQPQQPPQPPSSQSVVGKRGVLAQPRSNAPQM